MNKSIRVTVTIPEEERGVALPVREYHFCYECRHFIRHFVKMRGNIFSPLECGHCCPPKKYAHIKNAKAQDFACGWFEKAKED